MPKQKHRFSDIPPILTIVAAISALVSITFSILIYLKQ